MTTVLTVEPLGGNLLGGTMHLNFGGTITTGKTVLPVNYTTSMSPTSIDQGETRADKLPDMVGLALLELTGVAKRNAGKEEVR